MVKISWNRLRNAVLKNPDSATDPSPPFLAPPFTPDVVEAVRLISTRLALGADERSKLLWQAECNAAARMEYNALQPLFEHWAKPRRILEVGPGLGRSCIVFSKLGVWENDALVHLYDADGAETKYKQKHYDRPPQWPDTSSFCGNASVLKQILSYNGIANDTLFDAAKIPLRALPGPYDFIYGFYSIGFHWSLDHYLDDLDPLLHERSVLVCTLNKHFSPFPRLAQYSTRILPSGKVRAGLRPVNFLVLSKGRLPEVGLPIQKAFPA